MPEPLAYFLTWPTYGAWLPGDERGWVKYRHGWHPPDPTVKREAEARMTEDACILDIDQRQLVELTIADHCRVRGWTLFAVNCRSNHVHVVVGANCEVSRVRDQFKASCTRRLNALEQERKRGTQPRQAEPSRKKWWAERGSGQYVNDELGLEAIVHYVKEAQDRVAERDS
jgi:REP element-mobilizing transposase RayT